MDELSPKTGQTSRATVKGIFVNSHRDAVLKAHGPSGVKRLEQLVGQTLDFTPEEEIPVQLEVKIIEAAVQLLVSYPVAPEALVFEGGRLHLRNFLGTPWAQTLSGVFSEDFRFMMLHASTVAARVFEGIEFASEDLGPNCVKVIMVNSPYPTEHFRGLFHEWMLAYGLEGTVLAAETEPGVREYVMRWNE